VTFFSTLPSDRRTPLEGGDGLRFEDVRRAESITRLRRASIFLLPPLALALAVVVRIFGDSTPVRALALVGMLAIAAVTHVVVSQRGAGRRAIPIAIVFVLTLGVLLMGTVVELPGSHHAHVEIIAALMMGAAIMIPWGVAPQLLVAVTLALAYFALPGWRPLETGELVTLAVALIDCVALSGVGAWVLDRQRRRAFLESEEARRMTAQREVLLDASRQLGSNPDFDETVATITRLGHSMLPVDTVALILIDGRRGVLRTVSVAGNVLEVDREVMHLEVPLVALQPLLDELRSRGFAIAPGGALDALAELAREQFGVLSTLFVAIERNGELVGYMNFNVRSAPVRFTEEQIHLARGFAAHCGIALANAQLVADLQRANRVKTEFVSTMSHELRTPLSVILGYTDVLDEAVKDLESRVVVERIRVAGRELLELVQATLDLNRLESGQDPSRREAVGMKELWDELATQYEAVPHPKGVALRWEVVGMPVTSTDRRKLKIVVKNLVNNALKFTTEGEIHASVRSAGDRCLVVVRDSGIGIPAEDIARIFEMFHQLDTSDHRAHGGVGLGLYIVHRLVEQLGATLDVRSTVGRGTTFTLSIPLASVHPSAVAA
jgi:signal transduction histidine kinase